MKILFAIQFNCIYIGKNYFKIYFIDKGKIYLRKIVKKLTGMRQLRTWKFRLIF